MGRLDEFFGASPPWDPTSDGNEEVFHQGGLDGIDPSYDAVRSKLLAGAIGLDPYDGVYPSEQTQLSIEQELPQWGPPFVKFVDGRLSELEKKVEDALGKWQYQTQTYFNVASFNTDASGNVGTGVQDKANILTPPPGFTIALHRIGIFADGFNFGNPFTAAATWWELRIGNETIEGGSTVSGQGSIPVIKTWGTRDALRIRDGEVLSFFLTGAAGIANKRITIKMQGSVDRTIEG